jgi:hypothetical protein
MDMTGYLENIEYSATRLLEAVWAEHSKLDQLTRRLRALGAQTTAGYERAHAIALDAEDPDDVMLATGAHWETYFGPDRESYHLASEVGDLKQVVDLHAFSVASLAGSLLQHAKQGLSLVHGGLTAIPSGRVVAATQNLKTVIWQARNQATHWEEGKLTQPVRACFDDLRDNVDPSFGQYHSRCLAFEVVRLLDWTDFGKFKADLLSLSLS